MKTEKEINDAIAIVQEAARDGRLEVEMEPGSWGQCQTVFYGYKYRAKPDHIDGWFVLDIEDKTLVYNYPFSDEEVARQYAEKDDYPCRVVHLREVE